MYSFTFYLQHCVSLEIETEPVKITTSAVSPSIFIRNSNEFEWLIWCFFFRFLIDKSAVNTYLSWMMKKILVLPQILLVSFTSYIIQLTFIISISICPFIKINADTVRFHVADVLTKSCNIDFDDADQMVDQPCAIECFFRCKLQGAALFRVTEVFIEFKINSVWALKPKLKPSQLNIGVLQIFTIRIIACKTCCAL